MSSGFSVVDILVAPVTCAFAPATAAAIATPVPGREAVRVAETKAMLWHLLSTMVLALMVLQDLKLFQLPLHSRCRHRKHCSCVRFGIVMC